MMYPLVTELAEAGTPVTVTCGTLKLSRQPYYRWLKMPITDAEVAEAYRANALAVTAALRWRRTFSIAGLIVTEGSRESKRSCPSSAAAASAVRRS